MDSCYNFTLSQEDQEYFLNIGRDAKFGQLLKIIKEQKQTKKNIDFKEQSSSKFVLSQIDKKLMKETVNSFPIDLYLNDRTIYNPAKIKKNNEVPPERVYDVRFVMPLIYHSVAPGLFVDCRDFIARRCLAISLAGLSSEDPQMRALCYKILERYYEHLLSALLIDKQLWINFLDLLRNSIPSANARLRPIFTTFVVKIIDVLLHPNKDKMYELIKEFLSGRPRLNVNSIEIYDDLLNCSDIECYNNNLRWLMTLLRDGIKSDKDIKVIVDLNVIPQIICLYNSELRFDRANETICSIFIKLATLPEGFNLLIREYSIIAWLHQVILFHLYQNIEDIKNDPKSESLTDIVKSISSLIFTLVDSFIKIKDDNGLPTTRIMELINLFIVLHDLVIKSKNAAILAYYLDYVQKLAKSMKKDPRIPDQVTRHLLELIKAKLPYIA